MDVRLEGSVEDTKLIYRVLHAHLREHIELMDNELFAALQSELQTRARAEGVDVTDHAAWDAWLGNVGAASCEDRVARRETLKS